MAPKRVPRAVLSLYASVLRCHRHMLPGPLRDMGNRYARDEFRRHRDANTTPGQWREFQAEWRKYVGMLAGTADVAGGSGDIPLDTLERMTPEQKQRLAVLQEEARRAGQEMLGIKQDQRD
ncbi:hypothetical protein WJX72_009882 [[Myrmecia] bisecta]|uniref:Succinate dehydrogenase assembly factor 3 n=1 Tax=[Myrmecia] bisecta TaxID=41462 RepID=A0AAW1PXG5_9CHLO